MSQNERNVLSVFRRYRVGPNKMLCFNSYDNNRFQSGMRLLIAKGMLSKDSFKHSYFLTPEGYAASLAI